MRDHLDVLIDFPEIGTITVSDRAGRIRFFPCTDDDDLGLGSALRAARRTFGIDDDASVDICRVVEDGPGQLVAAPVFVG